jgi:hypothetical protein
MPPEVLELVGREGNPLERIRAAIAEVQAAGQSVTGRSVRAIARTDANVVDRVVRAFKAGQMPPLGEPWDNRTKPPAQKQREREQVTGPLGEEIMAADTVAKLELVGRKVTTEILEGTIEPRVGDLVIAGLREQRQAMRMRMLERQEQAVAAIEILTPEEVALLASHRAARAPKPLQPGEAAPPP